MANPSLINSTSGDDQFKSPLSQYDRSAALCLLRQQMAQRTAARLAWSQAIPDLGVVLPIQQGHEQRQLLTPQNTPAQGAPQLQPEAAGPLETSSPLDGIAVNERSLNMTGPPPKRGIGAKSHQASSKKKAKLSHTILHTEILAFPVHVRYPLRDGQRVTHKPLSEFQDATAAQTIRNSVTSTVTSAKDVARLQKWRDATRLDCFGSCCKRNAAFCERPPSNCGKCHKGKPPRPCFVLENEVIIILPRQVDTDLLTADEDVSIWLP